MQKETSKLFFLSCGVYSLGYEGFCSGFRALLHLGLLYINSLVAILYSKGKVISKANTPSVVSDSNFSLYFLQFTEPPFLIALIRGHLCPPLFQDACYLSKSFIFLFLYPVNLYLSFSSFSSRFYDTRSSSHCFLSLPAVPLKA